MFVAFSENFNFNKAAMIRTFWDLLFKTYSTRAADSVLDPIEKKEFNLIWNQLSTTR